MGLLKFFKKILKFEKSNLKYMFDLIKKDPERLLIGAIDPLSTGLWNTILGKDYDPIVDQLGGATKGSYQFAEARGIDTGPGQTMQGVAHLIAAFYAGNYGVSKFKSVMAAKAASAPAVGAGAGTTGGGLPATASQAPANVAGVVGPPEAAAAKGLAIGMPETYAASTAPEAVSFGAKVGKAFKGVGKFVKDNPTLVGMGVSGLGQGMMAASAAETDRDILRERYGNYAGTDPGEGYRSLASPGEEAPTTGVSRPYSGFEYQYDPKVGRIVRVPLQ